MSGRPEAGLVSGLYFFAMLIPNPAIQVRRLHDTGKSGWSILLAAIPFVGGIILIILYVLPSDGPNTYGTRPPD